MAEQGLRILIANERKDRLERIAEIVTGLGHEVISKELEVSEVAAATEREHPDLAFVGLGVSAEHALEMISEIVREAACPVIALLESDDAEWVNEAAKRGIFAYIVRSEERRVGKEGRSRCGRARLRNIATCRTPA